MVAENSEILYLDPFEELDETLHHAWRSLCRYYDAGGEIPGIQSLFEGADITMPGQAAEIVVANMLADLLERISRFSPWYTKPARVFGLSTFRDPKTKCIRWKLAPEAIQKWQRLIVPLADSICQNSGLIQAMLYVESLMAELPAQDECLTARCGCQPPHTINVSKSVLDKMEIVCKACKQPFA